MLSLRLKGRLGNQMFQYAAARTLADRKELPLVFHGPQLEIDQFFELKGERWSNLWQVARLKSRSLELFRDSFTPHYHDYTPSCRAERFDPAFFELKTGVEINGWFQSPAYFAGNEEPVRLWFTPKTRFRQHVENILAQLPESPGRLCAIHFRRTDYLASDCGLAGPEGWALPLDYYREAVGQMPEGTFYIVVSDAPDEAEEAFSWLPRKWISRANPSVVDMMLIAHCRLNIIANSSFSWWGAWLNSHPDRVVLYPKYYLGWALNTWVPDRIQVENWQAVEVSLPEERAEVPDQVVRLHSPSSPSLKKRLGRRLWRDFFEWPERES